MLAASTALAQANLPRPPEGPSVWVHVDGADSASLQQDVSGDDDWKTICRAPCDQWAPTGSWYRIAGRGLLPSDDFALDAPAGGAARIHVASASKSWRRVGDFMVGSGFLTALVGGYLLYLHYVLQALADYQGRSPPPTPDPAIGFALAGGGAAVGIAGLVPLLANYRTTVTQAPSPGQTPLPGDPQAPGPSETTPQSRRVAPVLGIPILAGTF